MSSESLGEPRLEWAAGGQHALGDSRWTRSSSSRKQQDRPASAVHAQRPFLACVTRFCSRLLLRALTLFVISH